MQKVMDEQRRNYASIGACLPSIMGNDSLTEHEKSTVPPSLHLLSLEIKGAERTKSIRRNDKMFNAEVDSEGQLEPT